MAAKKWATPSRFSSTDDSNGKKMPVTSRLPPTLNLASRKMGEEAGVQVNEIADKGPFQAAMAPVYEAYLAGNPDLRPLVEMIQATD